MFLIKPVTLEDGKLIATNKAFCLEKGDAQIACVETSNGVVYVGGSRYSTLQDFLSGIDAVNTKYARVEAEAQTAAKEEE